MTRSARVLATSLRTLFTAAVLLSISGAVRSTHAQSLFSFQASDVVQIRVGSELREYKIADVASLFLPYAVMSVRAYDELGGESPRPISNAFAGSKTVPGVELDRMSVLGEQWTYVDGHVGPPHCQLVKLACHSLGLGGLQYQIWKRQVSSREESPRRCDFAIVFRGTDFHSLDDWISNAHWITRLLPVPIFDQYAQVDTLMPAIMARIKRDPCYRSGTKIVAVGHSLGAGLAQHAAYIEPEIRYVYGFDPSPVTGFFDIDAMTRTRNVVGLSIDKMHEFGEVLAPLRFVLRIFTADPVCHPQVRLTRFNVLKGSLTTQHSIVSLTENLADALKGATPQSRRIDLPVATAADRQKAKCDERVDVRTAATRRDVRIVKRRVDQPPVQVSQRPARPSRQKVRQTAVKETATTDVSAFAALYSTITASLKPRAE